MSLITTFKYLTSHPLNRDNKVGAISRFLNWQIATRLVPYPIIYPLTTKSKLIVKKGMPGATGNFYCGLYEFYDMMFLLHFLRKDDLFVDIGANIGGYTVLASAHIGATTIAIEPATSTYSNLLSNIQLNQISEKVSPHHIAMGASEGSVKFTTSLDTINHVVMSDEKHQTEEIRMRSLDDVLQGQSPVLLKIDVEGFESEVLKGASATLQNKALQAIIIELNGQCGRYGFDDQKNHEKLLENGFVPYTYNPFNRELQKVNTFGPTNTTYIRDEAVVRERLMSAEKVHVRNKAI